MRANHPVLQETQAVAMPFRTGSMRRLTAAKGSASFSSANGDSSRHQNSVLAISTVQLRMPVSQAKRPRGTRAGPRRRGGVWRCDLPVSAAIGEEGRELMDASLEACNG